MWIQGVKVWKEHLCLSSGMFIFMARRAIPIIAFPRVRTIYIPYSPKFSRAINFAYFAKTDRPRKFYRENNGHAHVGVHIYFWVERETFITK